MKRINIAIDGPAGAGKSTIAKAVAKALGIYYLDTGAMYRAVAYAAVKGGVNIGSAEQVASLIESVDLRTEYQDGDQIVLLGDENVMPYIRTPEISRAASDISAYPCVRLKLAAMQRDVADKYDVVLDGRDIGTYVLPNAKYKFFLTGDAEERARRRCLELSDKGIEKEFDDVLCEMKTRDANDSARSFAPLKQAKDAVFIDTTYMNANEVLEAVLQKIR